MLRNNLDVWFCYYYETSISSESQLYLSVNFPDYSFLFYELLDFRWLLFTHILVNFDICFLLYPYSKVLAYPEWWFWTFHVLIFIPSQLKLLIPLVFFWTILWSCNKTSMFEKRLFYSFRKKYYKLSYIKYIWFYWIIQGPVK